MVSKQPMAVVCPFKGYIYSDKVSIGEVVAPPYDVINEEMQERLYHLSPYNVVRLILGKTFPEDDEKNNRYTRAAKYLAEWKQKGILKQLPEERFFAYHQRFNIEGKSFIRKAVVGRIKLEEPGKGSVIPHEKTLSAPKKDRFLLFTHTKMNLSPVFGIALDEGDFFKAIEEASLELLFKFTDEDGVEHEFFLVSKEATESIQSSLTNKKILIADGHHRYETAIAYQKERMKSNPNHTGEEPYNFVMMAIVSSKDPGLVVLPIHRVIKNFNNEKLANSFSKIKEEFQEVGEVFPKDILSINEKLKHLGKRHFAVYSQQEGFTFKIEDNTDELDVVLLHRKVFQDIMGITEEEIREKLKIEYFKSIREAVKLIEQGTAQAVFSYVPPTVEEIARYSLQGRIMPQKSTYFYPKFFSGLVLYSLE